jgi:hypothetical protein
MHTNRAQGCGQLTGDAHSYQQALLVTVNFCRKPATMRLVSSQDAGGQVNSSEIGPPAKRICPQTTGVVNK